MAEIRNIRGEIRMIAYYLPQYHTIPENDQAWGKGFTEWVNTRKAKPLFEGHYQPKVPLKENYYDLSDVNVMVEQAKLAKKYHLFGFCYYHYWFKNGKKLLEKPIEQMLLNSDVDIPFCLSWANENWSKRWDGGNQELIIEQNYGGKADWKLHLEYLVQFFRDPRYITLDGKPILLIYKPDLIPDVQEMLAYWQEQAFHYGFSGFCFMIQSPGLFYSPMYDLGEFSYQIKFPPFFSIIRDTKDMNKLHRQQKIFHILKSFYLDKAVKYILLKIRVHRDKERSNTKTEQTRLRYEDTWDTMLNAETSHEMIEGAFVDWDNTARKQNGYMHIGATPEKFKYYLKKTISNIKIHGQEPIIFINAWNEWAEGAYLEPDELHGYDYLKALKYASIEADR